MSLLGEGNSVVEFQLPKLATRVRFPSLAPFIWQRCFLKMTVHVSVVGIAIFLTGCAAVYYPEPTGILVDQGKGVYHTVEKGETLWKIAQMYQVDIDQIILLNNIADGDAIRKGQKIFIPGSYRGVRANDTRTEVARVETPRAAVHQDDFYKNEFAWPFKGSLLSSFHGRDAGFWDQGIRIKVPSGSQISAARQGKVVFVDDLAGYGPTVIVDHMDGFMSVYAGRVQPVVGLGDTVSKGNTVAVSSSGDTGFLYFEIRKEGVAANPVFYLPKS